MVFSWDSNFSKANTICKYLWNMLGIKNRNQSHMSIKGQIITNQLKIRNNCIDYYENLVHVANMNYDSIMNDVLSNNNILPEQYDKLIDEENEEAYKILNFVENKLESMPVFIDVVIDPIKRKDIPKLIIFFNIETFRIFDTHKISPINIIKKQKTITYKDTNNTINEIDSIFEEDESFVRFKKLLKEIIWKHL